MGDAVDLSDAGTTVAKTWAPALSLSAPGSSAWLADPAIPPVGRYTKVGGVLIAQFQIAATPTLGTGGGFLKITGPDNIVALGSPLPGEVINASGGFLTQRTGIALPAGFGGVAMQGFGKTSGRGLDFILMATKSDGSAAELLGASEMTTGTEVVLSGTFIFWLS